MVTVPTSTIGLRELRHKTGEVVTRVRNGETIDVTDHGRGVARIVPVETTTPTNLRVATDGTVNVTVGRTAIKEIAYGAIPVMAPAWGRRWGNHQGVVVSRWIAPGAESVQTGRELQRLADACAGRGRPVFVVAVDDPDVEVLSVKPADRGAGIIVRLRNWRFEASARTVQLHFVDAKPVTAMLCDARERDIANGESLVHDGVVTVPLKRHLTSVRIVIPE